MDRTFVLATEDIGREWLYTAMSRGRLENRLYVTAAPRERDDFAPAEPGRDAAEVLELAAERSLAQSLAIETPARTRSIEVER